MALPTIDIQNCWLLVILALVACNPAGGNERVAEAAHRGGETAGQSKSAPAPDELSAADCLEAAPGGHQLIDAAQGICFLYPDYYDVYENEGDGSLLRPFLP